MTPAFQRLRQALLVSLALAGGAATVLSIHWASRDYEQLRYAREINSPLELRHRLNLSAEGTWALLGMVLTTTSIGGLRQP